jgi:ArsR family transcriptional regulator
MSRRAAMNAERFVEVAKALADPTRRRMIDEIRAEGELTCSCLCALFSTTQPTISHHVRTLAEAGVIKIRKEGPFHVLSLNEAALRAFTRAILPAAKLPTARRSRRVRRK